MSDEPKIVQYELTDDEHQQLCEFVKKGFKDSLRRFMEEVTTNVSKAYADANTRVILSEKTFNPDPQSNRIAPLVLAALEGRLAILNLFLEVFKTIIDANHGSYIEYPNLYMLDLKQVEGFKTRGVTALNAACTNGFTEIAKKLIQFGGVSINKHDYFGYSPLGNAARYGRIDTVEYLLSRGADITHKTNDGYTPMHLAALYGQHEVVDLMLKKMIRPMFPNIRQLTTDFFPCPLYLAAMKGWQPVVDVFTAHETCPGFCKIDAQLLLGAAARMFWRDTSSESSKGIVDIWIEARKQTETRDLVSEPINAYGKREELKTEEELIELLESSKFEEESLYQCLMIYERCLGPSHSYHWIFLVGIKMFERQHYKEAEVLWKRAMNKHYGMAQLHVGSQTNWQHDLKGTTEYMIKFSSSLESMVRNGYTPMWEEYIDYALQQLKIGILTSLQSNLLDTSSGILKIYYCLLQILSCWIDTEVGQPDLQHSTSTLTTLSKPEYSESLLRAGQSFIDTASVLTHTNLIHITIYPAAPLFRGTHWQSVKRVGGLLLGLINFGLSEALNDLDHCGNRPLHVAAKLPNKPVRDTLISVLLASGAHVDSLNKSGMTPHEVFKINYPNQPPCFPCDVPRLACLAAREITLCGIEFQLSDFNTKVREILRFHTLAVDADANTATSNNSWITLPTF